MTWWSQGLGWLVYDGARVGARDHGWLPIDSFKKNEFWFNHIGDAFDTTLLMWGTRGIIEGFDQLRQRTGKDAISPRAKMWTSVLVGMAIPIAIETLGLPIGGNTAGSDIADSFGPLVAGILAGSSWELVNLLGDTETWVKGANRVEIAKDKLKNMKTNAENMMGNIGQKIQEGILQHMEEIDASIDYITMETRVASLMLDDFTKRQSKRFDNIQKGILDEEV